MNQQPVEKLHYADTDTLDVFKVFPTIQGEGPHVGRPAVFVRLAGCNLQCPMCDTDYTSRRTATRIDDLVDDVRRMRAQVMPVDSGAPDKGVGWRGERRPVVVITGGEPFRQNITVFANTLVALGYPVQVETNGTLPPPPRLHEAVMIVCSPKTGRVNAQLLHRVNAYKYVGRAYELDLDGLPWRALDHPCAPRLFRPPSWYTGPVYLQPADEGDAEANARNLEACVASCMRHGHTLGVQLHKTIGRE